MILYLKCETFKVLPSPAFGGARQVLNSRLYIYTLANQESASEASRFLLNFIKKSSPKKNGRGYRTV